MIEHCREQLQGLTESNSFDHPGLGLNRYLRTLSGADNKDEKQWVTRLLTAAAASTANSAYSVAFRRWAEIVKADPARRFWFEGALAGPLAIGLGGASAMEIGLTVHHTYGMPVIPGSALKGLARRAAQILINEKALTNDEFTSLFGDTKTASYFVFHDAWYAPGSEKERPFKRDVITVHHPKYYQRRGKDAWPTDFDDPTPNAFLVVKPAMRFLFTMDAPSPGWGNFACNLLRWGLENLGAGAKTNAGYGYFDGDKWYVPPPPPVVQVWPQCTLTKRIDQGAVEVTIRTADGVATTLNQSKWRPLELTLPKETKERFTNKRPITADVTVRITGDSLQVIAIKAVGEASA